jgi:hypothetical protein
MSELKLYDYWRSSAAYRLRIALNLKGLDYTSQSVNIAPGADEQFQDGYRALNPQKARILLQLLLASGETDPAALQRAFDGR